MIEITSEYLKQIFDYDNVNGLLIWKTKHSFKIKIGDIAGTVANHRRKQYRHIRINKIRYKSSRLIWLYHKGQWPSYIIDHISGDSLDDRIENLRDVTIEVNNKNIRMRRDNTSGTTGVCWYPPTKKWIAQIVVNYKPIFLGYFPDLSNAINARNEANTKYGFHKNHGTAPS